MNYKDLFIKGSKHYFTLKEENNRLYEINMVYEYNTLLDLDDLSDDFFEQIYLYIMSDHKSKRSNNSFSIYSFNIKVNNIDYTVKHFLYIMDSYEQHYKDGIVRKLKRKLRNYKIIKLISI